MPSPSPTASPAPSPFVNGNSAFQSRDELIQAVDLYMLALFEGSAENSSVAQRYGYPMRNWDVSGVQDFRRVFDFSRRGDLDRQNPAFLNFDEDLEGWDGKPFCRRFIMCISFVIFHQYRTPGPWLTCLQAT
jgi:hypothetical protein